MELSLSNAHLIDVKGVLALVPVHRSTLYRWERHGNFPESVKLGPRRKAWRRDDVLTWIANRDCSQTAMTRPFGQADEALKVQAGQGEI